MTDLHIGTNTPNMRVWGRPIAFFPVDSIDTEKKIFATLRSWAIDGAPGWFDDTAEMLQELGAYFLM